MPRTHKPQPPRCLPKATHSYPSSMGGAFDVVLLGRCEEGQLRARVVTKGFENLTFIPDPSLLKPLTVRTA